MRLLLFAFFGILLLVAAAMIAPSFIQQSDGSTQSANIPDGYNLVFGDDFETAGLDDTKWEYRYVNRPYLAGFLSEDAIAQPGDGYLHLVTTYADNTFLTGMIQSIEQFQYGYFEARIRFQSLQGHHGAFWLQSLLYGQFLDDPGKSGAEIDIIEFFGSGRNDEDAQHNVYWNAYDSPHIEKRNYDLYIRRDSGDELSEDFHIFALLWTQNEYLFFIDGVETWRLNEGVSHTSQYVVLSLITAAWENERLDASKLPDEMLVDYVRVYAAPSS